MQDDLNKAQELADQAFAADDPLEKTRLAHQALEFSDLCADAFVILGAYDAETPEEALAWYEKGVEAGPEAVDDEVAKGAAGKLWEVPETRAYMRARGGLAITLHELGRTDEAIAHAEELLRLNPRDDQNISHFLVHWWVQVGEPGRAATLLDAYEHDGTATWSYGHLLVALAGDSPAEEEYLGQVYREAVKANDLIQEYLLGVREPPVDRDILTAEHAEAIEYVYRMGPAWSGSPHVLDEVRELRDASYEESVAEQQPMSGATAVYFSRDPDDEDKEIAAVEAATERLIAVRAERIGLEQAVTVDPLAGRELKVWGDGPLLEQLIFGLVDDGCTAFLVEVSSEEEAEPFESAGLDTVFSSD